MNAFIEMLLRYSSEDELVALRKDVEAEIAKRRYCSTCKNAR